MGGKFDIYIIDGGGEYRVRPAVSMIDGNTRKFRIRNMTSYTAFLAFPASFLDNHEDVVLVPAKSDTVAHLHPGLDGHYHFAVVINKNGGFVEAKGESAPSVIVDP